MTTKDEDDSVDYLCEGIRICLTKGQDLLMVGIAYIPAITYRTHSHTTSKNLLFHFQTLQNIPTHNNPETQKNTKKRHRSVKKSAPN